VSMRAFLNRIGKGNGTERKGNRSGNETKRRRSGNSWDHICILTLTIVE
jgi:hypothetical protein